MWLFVSRTVTKSRGAESQRATCKSPRVVAVRRRVSTSATWQHADRSLDQHAASLVYQQLTEHRSQLLLYSTLITRPTRCTVLEEKEFIFRTKTKHKDE